MRNEQNYQGKDPQMWQLAQRRASFKGHFTTYLIMSIFFWLLWYFAGSRTYGNGVPWPVWPMLGWGIGVALHYLGAYGNGRQNNVGKEYEKLMNERNQTSKL